MPKDTDFPCPYCEYKSKSRDSSNLTQHIKCVHEKRRDYQCSMCNYAASIRKVLNQHVKSVHEKIRDLECKKCDFKCSLKGNLVKHMKEVHDKIKDHECPRCGKKFTRSHRLLNHIDKIHERSENTRGNVGDKSDHITETICQLCGFKSSKISELARHAMEHSATEN